MPPIADGAPKEPKRWDTNLFVSVLGNAGMLLIALLQWNGVLTVGWKMSIVGYLFVMAISLLAFWRWEEAVNWSKKKRRIWTLIIFAVPLAISILGTHTEYRREHEKASALGASSETSPNSVVLLRRPHLMWTFGRGEEGLATTFDPYNTGKVLVIIAGRIENRSPTPSTISNWGLEVTLPEDPKTVNGELLRPSGKSLSAWNGISLEKEFKDFTWDNYLPESTSKKPVETGSPAIGWVAFVVSDVPNDRLVAGTILKLYFHAELGESDERTIHLIKPLARFPYIPGLMH